LDHRSDNALNARPASREQADDGDTAITQILLLSEMRIGCDQNLEAIAFGCFEQLAVLERRPATFVKLWRLRAAGEIRAEGPACPDQKVCALKPGRGHYVPRAQAPRALDRA